MKPVRPEDWWDTRLTDEKTMSFFTENLGGASMPSRVAVRRWAEAEGVGTVLDVGCGPAIDRWEDSPVRWTGVDASRVLVLKNKLRGVDVHHARADALPFEDESFDLVYSRHVWEHLADFRPALKEATRVARQHVAVTFFRPPGAVAAQRVDDGAYYNDYKLADVVREFNAAWPHCGIEFKRLPRAKYLPAGEMIVFVTKE